MIQYSVALSKTFHQSLNRLSRNIVAEVMGAIGKLQQGNPSVHVHKLENSEFVSVGVNQGAKRIICSREGGMLRLLWVDNHDDAYAWAKRHRSIQVGHHLRTVSTEIVQVPTQTEAAPAQVLAQAGPLSHLRDRELRRFNILPPLAEAIRNLCDDGLLELAELLKPPLGEALLDLAQDSDRLSQVWFEFDNRRKQILANRYTAPTTEQAARSVVNAGELWIPTSNQQLMKSALSGDLMDWRIFLHPTQSRLVKRHYRGAARVTGGPGTGKTVVALHRARHLLTEVFPTGRVLITTFNRTLAEQIKSVWEQLTNDEPEVQKRADILTLTELSQQVLGSVGAPSRLITEEILLSSYWTGAQNPDYPQFTRAFLQSEREHVVGRWGAWTRRAYLSARRERARMSLRRPERGVVFDCISAFDRALKESGGGDSLALAREATQLVATGKAKQRWAAIVCDEVQDASAGELRLLAALTRSEEGICRENALFLCGDGYQRLYSSPIPLTRCGVDIRGRSQILRLNYRTTEGIRSYAVDIAKKLPPDVIDVPDEQSNTGSSLGGYRSVRGGERPVVHRFDTVVQEAEWIATLPQPVLVLTRTTSYRDRLEKLLRAVGQDPQILEGRGELGDQITLCTLHRSKGLEAKRVVIAGRQLIPARWPGGDKSDKALWLRQESCLLYVGITRARDHCEISVVG